MQSCANQALVALYHVRVRPSACGATVSVMFSPSTHHHASSEREEGVAACRSTSESRQRASSLNAPYLIGRNLSCRQVLCGLPCKSALLTTRCWYVDVTARHDAPGLRPRRAGSGSEHPAAGGGGAGGVGGHAEPPGIRIRRLPRSRRQPRAIEHAEPEVDAAKFRLQVVTYSSYHQLRLATRACTNGHGSARH